MASAQQIRLGSVIIKVMDKGRRFVFQDAHNEQQYATIEDADVPEVIRFLYRSSASAQQEITLK